MITRAKLRYLRKSPRKVRLVADMVRGISVIEAKKQLAFSRKGSARPLKKLIDSAVANAVNNNGLKEDNLFIKEIRVDDGPTLKRWRARAFGRASTIRKRTSHISVLLDEYEPTAEKPAKEKKTEIKTQKIESKESVMKEPDEKDIKDKKDSAKENKVKQSKTKSAKPKVFNRKAG